MDFWIPSNEYEHPEYLKAVTANKYLGLKFMFK